LLRLSLSSFPSSSKQVLFNFDTRFLAILC
jgi:hypothetical protein